MSGSVNKVLLLGHVGRDPEVHTFQSGDRVVSFSLAMTESWKNRETGERQSRTEWANVRVLNEGIGKVVESYVRKGSQLFVEGQLQTREWTDKEGTKRKSTDIVVPRFGGALTLLGGKDRDDGKESSGQPNAAPASPTAGVEDEIPF